MSEAKQDAAGITARTEIAGIRKSVEELSSEIGELFRRLEPVMANHFVEEQKAIAAERETFSEVVMDLQDLNEGVIQERQRIVRILQTLEV